MCLRSGRLMIVVLTDDEHHAQGVRAMLLVRGTVLRLESATAAARSSNRRHKL
jgi:hypothetical protein